jgi:hypothetical protein
MERLGCWLATSSEPVTRTVCEWFKARITHQHLVGDDVFEYEVQYHVDVWSTMWDESVLEDGLRFEDAVSVECCWAGVRAGIVVSSYYLGVISLPMPSR